MKSRSLLKSFQYALQGLKAAYIGEKNFRIHCIAVVLVVICGVLFGLSIERWVLLVLTIAFVLVCEVFNTVAETLADMITQEYSPQAKKVKDLAAGAVLISAIAAVLVGAFIFIEPALACLKTIFGM
ncbi:MAG: diacylglycerol kinase family protein [Thermoclostridium sp.]|nr:diacylglycerol kinase family protein [Thermoclostridium sp.]